MNLQDMSVRQRAVYAARGNIREARYARLEGREKKAEWHLGLAASYRQAAMLAEAASTENGQRGSGDA